MAENATKVGLIVRSAPFQGRSGRDQLDLALAAGSLGFELELFFIGDGVLQLLGGRACDAAGLPGGIRGWQSLPELTPVTAWVSRAEYSALAGPDTEWMLEVQPAGVSEMSRRVLDCAPLMVV
jgi:tRNA 2-thiouridine synthesizing protein C